MNKIIGVAGKAGAGKDTVANALSAFTVFNPLFPRSAVKMAFADSLKRAAAEAFNLPLENFYERDKKEDEAYGWPGLSPRKIAQDLGVGMRELFGEYFWAKSLASQIDKTGADLIIIPDVRFPQEAHMIRNEWGGEIIYVDRPGLEELDHVSEKQDLSGYLDAVIINDGTIDDLRNKLYNIYIRPKT